MKKTLGMIFLLTVCVLLAAGCGRRRADINEEAESVAGMETVLKGIVPEKAPEPTSAGREETEAKPEQETLEPEKNIEPQGSNVQPQQAEPEKTKTPEPERQEEPKLEPEKPTPETEAQSEPNKPEEPKAEPKPEKTEPVSYSPQRVAELAVERIKAEGKIYIPDDLDQMLAAGELSQEDYDVSYPADGAGYLEYYVTADMNEARDISGTVQFYSEDDIAENIAGMYASLPQQYFYIEYCGTAIYGGKECHVFYCYRA